MVYYACSVLPLKTIVGLDFSGLALSRRQVHSLGFVLQTYSADQFGFTSAWLSSEGWPAGGWLLTIQADIWAAQMRALLPSFTQAFGTVVHPSVTVRSAGCLSGGGGAVDGECTAKPVRARAWRERCDHPDQKVTSTGLAQKCY